MSKDPTSHDFPSYDAIDQALRRAEAASDAAEAHGSLCGLVCALGDSGLSIWLAETLAETGAETGADIPADSPANAVVAGQTRAILGTLAASTRAALEGAEMSFQPLLLADEEPLAERVDGLAQWCQGFNHGLFVAARISSAEAEVDSGNTAEVVHDFGELAQVSVGDDEPDADGEAAYAELVEYVRVGVQLVYEELAAVRQRIEAAGQH